MRSEREGEDIWKPKRFTDFKGGWTEVRYKKRQKREEGIHHPLHNDGGRTGGRTWRQERGVSLFVDNLPAFYDGYLLRKLFRGFGVIIDCHIPWRRRINKNTRYGFVTFEKEEAAARALRKLDGVEVFRHKVMVMKTFMAAAEKGEGAKESEGARNNLMNSNINNKGIRGDGRSYAQVLAPQKLKWVEKKTHQLFRRKKGRVAMMAMKKSSGSL